MKYVRFLFGCAIIVYFIGCMSGGTHGSIKRYRYHIQKRNLEIAIRQVMLQSSVVHQDSVKSYYNDDSNYVSLSIKEGAAVYTYTFRYYGDSQYWDTSSTSEIFIAYAHDENGKGGSSGGGGANKSDSKLIRKLTEPFENEFISKIDSILAMKHTEE